MSTRGIIASNVAAGISIRKESRYTEPVTIPKPEEVFDLLRAADALANSKNKQTARTWGAVSADALSGGRFRNAPAGTPRDRGREHS